MRGSGAGSEPISRAGAPVPAASVLGRATSLLLFVALAFGLVVPKVAGGVFLLLGLIAIIWLEPGLARRNWRLDAHERRLVLVVVLFVAVWLAAWLFHGPGAAGLDDLGKILRLLLIVPIYLFLRMVDGLERAWWIGLAAGATVAGCYALGFALAGQPGEWAERVGGPTNPIYFGGIVLAFALMLLPRVTDPALAAGWRMLAGLAVALALTASAMSGSRGAWLALPPLLVLYLLTLGSRQSPAWRFGVPAAILAFAVALAFVPGVPLGERIAEGFDTLTTSLMAAGPNDPLAIRWHLWQLSFDLARDSWLFGHGPGGFRAALEQAVADGRLAARYLEFHHPHNQFLSALLIAGLPGLASLALLFGVPMWRFAVLWRSGLARTRRIGWCGLAALAVIAVMCLSESIFQRNSGIVWFALLTAASAALVRVRQRRERAQPTGARRHRLSVIMICRDEADRIANALESVAGWADEIVVLDSGSVDETVSICRRYTDRVEVTDWPGFGPQKQRALERAGGDWVLSLDADEVVSPGLRHEIDQILSQPEPHFDGYRLPWRTRAFGGELQFGHWARAPLRLVRREAARFTDAVVHERLVLTGPGRRRTGRLEEPLYHDVFRDVAHAREKLSRYAALQARARHAAGRRAGAAGARLRAAWNLFDNFVVRGAFLDGRRGWLMSRLYAEYTLAKYRELARLTG